LKDMRARPNGDHDGRAARRYLFTLIARSSCPRGTWRSRSCAVPGDGSRGHGARGGPGAATGPGGGSWSHEAHGGPGAVLCQETGAEATGHVAVLELPQALVVGAGAMRHVTAPELPCARRREPRDTLACAPVLSFIFDLELVREGIRSSGYRQTAPGAVAPTRWVIAPGPSAMEEREGGSLAGHLDQAVASPLEPPAAGAAGL
jgi:hypothetical protein